MCFSNMVWFGMTKLPKLGLYHFDIIVGATGTFFLMHSTLILFCLICLVICHNILIFAILSLFSRWLFTAQYSVLYITRLIAVWWNFPFTLSGIFLPVEHSRYFHFIHPVWIIWSTSLYFPVILYCTSTLDA